MEILRSIVIVIHLIGFATLFGAWIVEATSGRREITKLMHWGLAIALVAGLALAAPWGVDGDMNYAKIGTKLVVVIAVGALLGIGGGRQKRTGSVPAAIFWLTGILTLLNASIAVLW
ncbi:Fe-S protein [Microbacterium karelineae]|uniref:Fe-S protein n=1 Tax=Microbacterium karelineae TaxID=2654283 RepID=UPI0012E9BC4A|nr:Fe-S protein [Microbacterium karelineae]